MKKNNIFKTIHLTSKDISKVLNNEMYIPVCVGYIVMYISILISIIFNKCKGDKNN